MIFDAHHLPAGAQTDAVNQATTDVVAAFIEPMRGTASFVLYRSAARHFLYWLNRRRIPITDADTAIVRRFAEHRCCCPYYSAKQLRDPVYISRSHRRAVAMRVGSIVVVLQIRKTFQLQRLPVMSSTCPPVTMWSLRFSAVTVS
jgi:hypothetical protein